MRDKDDGEKANGDVMTNDRIQEIAFRAGNWPARVRQKPNMIAAHTDSGTFLGKLGAEGQPPNPAWMGNEVLFYALAAKSNLPMPKGAILSGPGNRLWGSEYLEVRQSIFLLADEDPRKSGRYLIDVCESSPIQLRHLAKALLIDVALLNNDRQPWNMLFDGKSLSFFDHEKTLVGDGQSGSGLVRISSEAVSRNKFNDYLRCVDANNLVLDRLTEAARREIFESLCLDATALASAVSDCPNEWIPAPTKDLLREFLPNWWAFIRCFVHENSVAALIAHGVLRHT